ncbi:hypothetical protein ACFL21_05075 [Patescibacteria group bacterium]
MKISPKEFAELLKGSTLDKEQRKIIVKSLSSMSPEMIEGLTKILKTDSDHVKKVVKEVDEKQKAEVEDFKKEIKDLDLEEEE